MQHCPLCSPQSASEHQSTLTSLPRAVPCQLSHWTIINKLPFLKLEELFLFLLNKNLAVCHFQFLHVFTPNLSYTIQPWSEVKMHITICSHRIHRTRLSSYVTVNSLISTVCSMKPKRKKKKDKKKKTLGKCHIALNYTDYLYPSYATLASSATPSRTVQTLTQAMNQRLCQARFPSRAFK